MHWACRSLSFNPPAGLRRRRRHFIPILIGYGVQIMYFTPRLVDELRNPLPVGGRSTDRSLGAASPQKRMLGPSESCGKSVQMPFSAVVAMTNFLKVARNGRSECRAECRVNCC
jgi:hypothetical protein